MRYATLEELKERNKGKKEDIDWVDYLYLVSGAIYKHHPNDVPYEQKCIFGFYTGTNLEPDQPTVDKLKDLYCNLMDDQKRRRSDVNYWEVIIERAFIDEDDKLGYETIEKINSDNYIVPLNQEEKDLEMSL